MRDRLLKQPLIFLFLSNLIVLFVGMGLFPLLPLYASHFGASKTIVGIYFAAMYISNAIGSMLPAWLGARVSRGVLFLAGSILGVPALLLLGKATSLLQVVILTSILWFSGGLVVALVNVFTGLFASKRSRGRSFSLMSLPMPLGTLIGGAIIGKLVNGQGYPPTFTVLGYLWIGLPLISLLFLNKDQNQETKPMPAQISLPRTQFVRSFYLLLGLTLASTLAINAGRLSTSLSMQTLNFSPAAIASSATVSGLATIPLTFFIGTLSDRFGRERLLSVGYMLATAGALTLVFATQLWQFWLAATCLLVALSSSGAMSFALATDVLERESLTRGLSWLKGTGAFASVISFASTGLFMDYLGPISLYVIAMILPIISAYLIEAVGCKAKRFVPLPAGLRNDFFCM